MKEFVQAFSLTAWVLSANLWLKEPIVHFFIMCSVVVALVGKERNKVSEKIRHRQKAGHSNHKMPHKAHDERDGNHRSNSHDRRNKRREQRDFEREISDKLYR